MQPKTPESTKNAYLMALVIVMIGFTNAICSAWEYEIGLESGEWCLLEEQYDWTGIWKCECTYIQP